jgi:hypothetical protein
VTWKPLSCGESDDVMDVPGTAEGPGLHAAHAPATVHYLEGPALYSDSGVADVLLGNSDALMFISWQEGLPTARRACDTAPR